MVNSVPTSRTATGRRQFLRNLAAAAAGALLVPGQRLFAQAAPSAANPSNVHFVDVTEESGMRFKHERAASSQKLYVETMGAGCGWLDYNQDGFLDAIFVNSGPTPFFHPGSNPQPALYRNNGNGTFTDVSAACGIKSDGGFYFGVAIGDYDNDGYPDLYMTGYGHSVLYHNNRDGSFTNVTTAAGVANENNWATAAGWFDFDHDGQLDLLVTNYVKYDWNHDPYCGRREEGFRVYCDPFRFPGSSMRLYHNNGDGTFSDWTQKAGLANPDGKSLGLALADFDGDGWEDILIANDGMRNFLYLNNRNGTFRDVTYESGAGYGDNGEVEAGMGIDAADVNDDGRLDFYVCHMDNQLNRFYLNQGKGNFKDLTLGSGLGLTNIENTSYAARFFDWDNDGNRDLLVVNGSMLDNIRLYHPDSGYDEAKRLYRNLGDGKFVDATASQEASFLAPGVGRGLAVGDYDNDGALDFLQSNNGGRAQLFRNKGASANHWLGLKLVGTKSNRDAVGAALKLTSGDLTSFDQVKGGTSYCSAQDLRVYFGLGSRSRVDSLKIVWPSGTRETLQNLTADQILLIKEGQGVQPYRFPLFKRS